MTNAQMVHRIGCSQCDFTGTVYLRGFGWDTCRCTAEVADSVVRDMAERGLDEDNYMELEGIKKN